MVRFMNNNILIKVDKLISYVKDTEEYKDYIYLYNKLKNNSLVNKLIKEVKDIQKKIVKEESLGNDTKGLEERVSELLKDLNGIPLYTEFVDKQSELNIMFQTIKQTLDDYFFNKLN